MGDTIGMFAKRMNVSIRTLRYYDEIDLLKPTKTNSKGHKLYGAKEQSVLQRIQAWKFLGVPLEDIKGLLDESNIDFSLTLSLQKKLLLEQKQRMEAMIDAVEDAQTVLKLSEGKAKEYMEVLYMVLNTYRLEKEQKKFLLKHFPTEWVDQLYQPFGIDRKELIKHNTNYLFRLFESMKNNVNPTSEEVQTIIEGMLKDVHSFVDPVVVKEVADKIELFEEHEHLFHSPIPDPFKEYMDKAVSYYYSTAGSNWEND
ncbi:MerR family transcriptional regulator [Evansella tamaricis]|uniref:MerR family transcriptional regulator n=1 Tax=Evansella tamaricis TaxID=2069301 RepID=UPI0036D3EABB